MTPFKKWPSAENHYRDKFISMFLGQYPELATCRYVCTEKLHGSNFSWTISPDEPIRAGSRNNYLNMDGSFQGAVIQELHDAHSELLDDLQFLADGSRDTIRLFGELHGKGIQKGVDYGSGKKLLYFGIMTNDELQPFEWLMLMVSTDYLVPIIEIADSLLDALEIESKFNSLLSSLSDNICEGVVIMPYERVFNYGHSVFMIKKKNAAFLEVASVKKIVASDPETVRLNLLFRAYINDNRLQSLFSKVGEIEESAQIGMYIRELLADAKTDFLKDNNISHLDTTQEKKVFNVGGTIANMLKAYL